MRRIALLSLLLVPWVLTDAAAPATAPLALPGVEGPIGFDDLVFAPDLNRVLVPAGRTGRLFLVDAGTLQSEAIEGVAPAGGTGHGHGEGTTSADAGGGLLFASDRTGRTLAVVDRHRGVVARAHLGGGPDYVRWVGPLHEIWVSEPGRERIETFRLESGDPPRLVAAGSIPVADGPESLVIDAQAGRAYTNTWHDATVAIALGSRKPVARWANGCKGGRGIALAARARLLFVGCEEGEVVGLDLRDGRVAGRARTGAGVDVIACSEDPPLVFVPGADPGTIAVVRFDARGGLQVIETVPTSRGAHCVAADARGDAFVCDPERGRLLLVHAPRAR